ncbi:TIR domain-containing protein [Mucilaginibacter sp. AW1-3]
MQYKYDIFISYRRDEEAKRWIDNHFFPLLKFSLRMALGRTPEIYIDDQLEGGVIWPKKLGEEISFSRILIVLWSGDYLNSEWCVSEMSAMLEREVKTGCRQGQSTTGLIFPFIVHDGENLPIELKVIQNIDVKKYFNPRMNIYSENAEKLSQEISNAAAGIANLINSVPPWQDNWKVDTINDFYQRYYDGAKTSQTTLPKFTS